MLLGVATAAQAATSVWYGYKGAENCWQTGQLGAENFGCDTVGAGYLNASGHTVNNSAFAIGQDLELAPSGDYCTVYEVGDGLTLPETNNQAGATGFETPTPFGSYQESDGHGNVCQASGATWGEEVGRQVAGNGCFKTCGMHHWVSFHDQGLNDRPWAEWFGSPSLTVSASATAQLFTYSNEKDVGAWGYVCPILQDRTTGDRLEYCFQQWRSSHNEKPTWETEHGGGPGYCNGWAGHSLDMVQTMFYPGTIYSTQAPGSANTLVLGAAGWHHYEANITASNLVAAVNAVNANCGRAASRNPADWAVLGVEHGLEGWRSLVELAGASSGVYLATTYTPLPPTAVTEGGSNYCCNTSLLQGSVNAEGQSTSYHFDYGLTAAYGQSTTSQNAGSATSPVSVGLSIPTISATEYHFRVVATNAAGTTYGEDKTFVSGGPAAETNEASEISETTAVLNGRINPRGPENQTQYYYELGTTTSYGTTIESSSFFTGGETWKSAPVNATGLTPNTLYHYRLVAYNDYTTYGADATFTTLPLNSTVQCGGVNLGGQGSTLQRIAQGVWDSGFNSSTDPTACNGSQGAKGTPHVSYSATGSGAGLSSWGVQGGSVNYGVGNAFIGTDEPPNAAQLQEIEAHEPTLIPQEIETVPVLQAAVAIIVHLPSGCTATSTSASGRLALNYTTLEQIFRGTITKWSQITEDGDKLSGGSCNSATTIVQVVRRDQSGTSHILKKYLGLIYTGNFEAESGQQTNWNSVAEGAANTQWPKAAKVVRPASNGAEALLSTVAATAGSISYVNLSDARGNATFVPPTGGNGTATFWVALQNKPETYADPASNKDVAAPAEANCSKEEYTNGTEYPFPPENAYASWSRVTTRVEEPKYPLCGLTYDLTLHHYSAFGGTELREATTARNFLTFVLDTSKEKEGNGANGGQALIKKHDYLELSGTVLKLAQKGAEAPAF